MTWPARVHPAAAIRGRGRLSPSVCTTIHTYGARLDGGRGGAATERPFVGRSLPDITADRVPVHTAQHRLTYTVHNAQIVHRLRISVSSLSIQISATGQGSDWCQMKQHRLSTRRQRGGVITVSSIPGGSNGSVTRSCVNDPVLWSPSGLEVLRKGRVPSVHRSAIAGVGV